MEWCSSCCRTKKSSINDETELVIALIKKQQETLFEKDDTTSPASTLDLSPESSCQDDNDHHPLPANRPRPSPARNRAKIKQITEKFWVAGFDGISTVIVTDDQNGCTRAVLTLNRALFCSIVPVGYTKDSEWKIQSFNFNAIESVVKDITLIRKTLEYEFLNELEYIVLLSLSTGPKIGLIYTDRSSRDRAFAAISVLKVVARNQTKPKNV